MARMNALADVVKGLKANIHAIDNLSPVSRVAVYVRAGSRYEPDDVPGVAHFMRASAGLTTRDSSVLGIVRHTERMGGSIKVTSDREYIVYKVECLRDKLGYLMSFIDDTLHKPEFRSWEIVDYVQPRLKHQLGLYKKNQALLTNEALHKAAFRGGLAHSMFVPEHQVEKIKNTHLFDYLESNFILDRMSFTGLGVDENEIRDIVEQRFNLVATEPKSVSGASRYVGGGEARVQAGFPQTMVNYVVQGYRMDDLKSQAALEVISSILGGEKQAYIKYGSGSPKTLAHQLEKLDTVFKSSLINLSYSDTGLFGFSIVGPNERLKEAVKTAIKHVKKVLSEMSENDLKNAKNATIARAKLQSEDANTVFDVMARRHAAGVINKSPMDLIERLTLKDVQAVAGSLLKSKPSIASVGNPRYVPYVDELDV